jgi:hypothetical protein
VLRIEAVVHNTEQLNCGRGLEKFTQIVVRARTILDRFAQTLSCVNACFVADETLEQLPLHARVGQTRVGGVDLNKPRLHHVVQALPALALLPEGFTASELAGQVRSQSGQTERNSTCRYQVPPEGL